MDRCCVATDDDRVASAVEALGARVVRVPATRGGSAERCAAAYGELRRRANATREDADFDVVVAVDCDEAFVEAHHIERVADAVVNSDAEIATLCRPSRGEEVRRSADGAPTSPPKTIPPTRRDASTNTNSTRSNQLAHVSPVSHLTEKETRFFGIFG